MTLPNTTVNDATHAGVRTKIEANFTALDNCTQPMALVALLDAHFGSTDWRTAVDLSSFATDAEMSSAIAAALITHNGASDPHPGYLMPSEVVAAIDAALGSAGWRSSDAGGSVAVVNNLTSTSTVDALSAAQGKALKDAADALSLAVSGKATAAQGAMADTALQPSTVVGAINAALGGSTWQEGGGPGGAVSAPVQTTPASAQSAGTGIGGRLQLNHGTWAGNPILTYEWRIAGTTVGVGLAPYRIIESGDLGQTLTWREFATNGGGTTAGAFGTFVVAAAPSVPGVTIIPPTNAIPLNGDTVYSTVLLSSATPMTIASGAIEQGVCTFRVKGNGTNPLTITGSAQLTTSLAFDTTQDVVNHVTVFYTNGQAYHTIWRTAAGEIEQTLTPPSITDLVLSVVQVGTAVSYTGGVVTGVPTPTSVLTVTVDGTAVVVPYTPVGADIGKTLLYSLAASNSQGNATKSASAVVQASTGYAALSGYANWTTTADWVPGTAGPTANIPTITKSGAAGFASATRSGTLAPTSITARVVCGVRGALGTGGVVFTCGNTHYSSAMSTFGTSGTYFRLGLFANDIRVDKASTPAVYASIDTFGTAVAADTWTQGSGWAARAAHKAATSKVVSVRPIAGVGWSLESSLDAGATWQQLGIWTPPVSTATFTWTHVNGSPTVMYDSMTIQGSNLTVAGAVAYMGWSV